MKRPLRKNSGEIWYSAKEYYRDPDKQNVDKWKSDLSAREQIRTIMAFKERGELRQFGYDFSLDSVTQTISSHAKIYFVYRWMVNGFHRFSAVAVRKIPGISLIKKGLLALVR